MSRFVKLEFGDGAEDFSSGQHAAVKNEGSYAAEAQSAFENGNFEAALRLYSKVLEFNPGNVSAWTGQVRMLIELAEFKEAQLWADKALERFPQHAELLAAKAVALGRAGELEEALALSDTAFEQKGDTPYVWLARADVLLARNEKRAEYCLEKALLLAPQDWFIAWLAGRIRYYYGQFAAALKLIQQAVEWRATHFLLWLELGRCQEALGLVGAARHSFVQAQQLNPLCGAGLSLAKLSNTGLWKRLGRLCRSLWSR